MSERRIVFAVELTVWDPSLSGGSGGTRTLYYSTASFTTKPADTPANTFFDGRVKSPASMKRDLFDSGTTAGQSRTGYGSLVLLNGDGELDALAGYGFDGRTCVQKWGYEGAAYSTFTELFRTTMLDALVSQDAVTVKLRDRQAELHTPIQPNKYAGNNVLPAGLEGEADLLGKPKPLVFGRVKNVPAVLVNSAKLIYQVHEGAITTLADVYDRGVSLLDADDSTGWVDRGLADIFLRTTSFRNIHYLNGLFVALHGAGQVATSVDGKTWIGRTSNLASDTLFGAAYGAGLYVIVGTNGRVLRSSDAVEWISATISGNPTLRAVLYHAAAGLFIACGAGGVIYTSPDAITWTSRTSGTSEYLKALASDGTTVVAVGENGHTTRSTNGTAWTQQDLGTPNLEAVTYGAGLFVANGEAGYYTSPDGATWTSRVGTGNITTSHRVVHSTFANGVFYMVGYIATTFNDRFYTSTDGLTWTITQVGPNGGDLAGVAVGNARIVVGYNNSSLTPDSSFYTRKVDTKFYGSQADLLDDTKAPGPGAVGVYLAGGMFRLGSTPDGIPTANVVQADDTPAEMYDALFTRAGYTLGTDYLQADMDALPTYEIGISINDETTYAAVLDLLAETVGAWWGVSLGGVYRIAVVEDMAGDTPVLTFTQHDMKKPLQRMDSQDEGNGLPVHKTILRYARNYSPGTADIAAGADSAFREFASQEWRAVEASDAAVLTAHPRAQQLAIETLIQDPADAQTECDRRQALRGVRRERFQHSVALSPDLSGIGIGDDTFALDYGEVIEIKHHRHLLGAGKNFLVIGVNPDYNTREVVIGVWG